LCVSRHALYGSPPALKNFAGGRADRVRERNKISSRRWAANYPAPVQEAAIVAYSVATWRAAVQR